MMSLPARVPAGAAATLQPLYRPVGLMVLVSLGPGRRRSRRRAVLLMASSVGTARTLRRIRALAAIHAPIAIRVAAAICVLAMLGMASLRGLTMGSGAIAGLLRRGSSRSRHLVALMRRSGLRPCRDGKGEGCRSSNE